MTAFGAQKTVILKVGGGGGGGGGGHADTADSAAKLAMPRTISATGDADWSVSFDGSANAVADLTLAPSGAVADTYTSVTVNAKGLVTGGTNPTTLAGYGITDAATVDDLAGKVDKVAGKGLSSEDYTTADKNKLAGIEDGANNYTHPANHPASIITQDENNRFVTDAEKAAWGAKLDDSAAGSAPNELPSNQHLGAMAFLDTLGATQVTRHTRDSQPGDVWHEWVSNTELRKKFHGLDGVIRTITETYA